ncbi:MAG: arylformamidase [Planctomycetes bacterium]|nr:arylformamidase [Planctomycetota bacterium]MCB9869041.1 arylformamidase [Planctomycetota bacterium]MCB9888000.1 arylformamidase [Planctomycetota bacterium]
MRIYDISEPIAPDTAVFPGDTPFSAEWVMRIADGASCNVSTMRMSVHCGTHSDAPRHYDEHGADVASLDLTPYLGKCRVLEVGSIGDPAVVDPAELGPESLGGHERVLLRTAARHDHRVFDPGFVALGPAAAEVLASCGVRLIGIDTPSMDHATSKELAAHHVLRRAGICLLENLDLSRVPAGDYELIALPLKIVGSDASPVRAILRELPNS